jgi:hypothetical protein
VTDITDRGRRGGSRSPESVPVVRSAGLRIAGEVVHRAVLARGATHATRGRLGPHRAHVPGAATLAARWGASGDAVLVDADSARRCAVNASRATTARLVCSARQALIALAASPVFAVERRAERRRLVDPATRGRLDAGLARRTRCARVPLHPAGVIRIAERTDVSLAAPVGTILGVAGLDSTAGAAPAGLREANRRRALALLTELASETAAAVLREAVRAVHGVFAAALAVRRTAAGQRLDAGAALLALESRGTAPARDAAPPAGARVLHVLRDADRPVAAPVRSSAVQRPRRSGRPTVAVRRVSTSHRTKRRPSTHRPEGRRSYLHRHRADRRGPAPTARMPGRGSRAPALARTVPSPCIVAVTL